MEMHRFEKFFVNSDFCNFFHKKLLFRRFFRFIEKNLKGRALEIGCGIGKTTELIANQYDKLEITAIDYDKEQIKIAKRKQTINVKFLQEDGSNLKFKSSSFDSVIETNVFHHIKNYQAAIREVHRVLKKNCRFYLMDISKYLFIWPMYLLFPPESSFNKKEFIKSLESNGFKVKKSKGNLLFSIIARKIS